MFKQGFALLFFVSTVPLVDGCSNAPTPRGGVDMAPMGDPDARAVDPPACVGNWMITNVPRGGGDTQYAFGPDDTWQMAYQAPVAGLTTLGVRHVSESTITEADTIPASGTPALAIAPDGTAEAFVDVMGRGIVGFRRTNGDWQQMGDAFGTYRAGSLLHASTDKSGHAHVGFDANYAYYATDATGAWAVEQIGPQPEAIVEAIVVDATDHVHVFYGGREGLDPFVEYWATKAGGTWQVTSLPPKLSIFTAAVDHKGRPHVLVTQNSDGTMHHLWYEAGAWKDEPLPAAVGFVQSARFDATDQLHVAGADLAGNVLYATNPNGNWMTSVVTSAGAKVRTYATVALDSAGRPRIAADTHVGEDLPPRHLFAQPCP